MRVDDDFVPLHIKSIETIWSFIDEFRSIDNQLSIIYFFPYLSIYLSYPTTTIHMLSIHFNSFILFLIFSHRKKNCNAQLNSCLFKYSFSNWYDTIKLIKKKWNWKSGLFCSNFFIVCTTQNKKKMKRKSKLDTSITN